MKKKTDEERKISLEYDERYREDIPYRWRMYGDYLFKSYNEQRPQAQLPNTGDE
jgi:hypothetical protein